MPEVSINMRMEGLPTLNRRISNIDGRFKNMSIMQFARATRDRAKLELRRGYIKKRAAQRTGTLERSIKAKSLSKGKEAIVFAAADHANLVEYGRGPVRPRDKKFLVFIGARGEFVRTRYVRATKPVLFMEKARIWAEQNMLRYVAKRVSRIIESGGTVDDFSVRASI